MNKYLLILLLVGVVGCNNKASYSPVSRINDSTIMICDTINSCDTFVNAWPIKIVTIDGKEYLHERDGSYTRVYKSGEEYETPKK